MMRRCFRTPALDDPMCGAPVRVPARDGQLRLFVSPKNRVGDLQLRIHPSATISLRRE